MNRWTFPLLFLAGCVVERDRAVEEPCATWEKNVRATLSLHCSTCHSGATPEAGYDVTTYHGAIATATAGDEASGILMAHPMEAEAVLQSWVLDCDLSLRNSRVHAPGLQNPASQDFHGRDIDFDLCARCHGDDFKGGRAQSSCTTCHEAGPTDCSTCHKDGIDAAHRAHSVDCSTCHVEPARWDDPGHIDPPPAEVILDCGSVWCHGDANPRWIAGAGEAACGTCHGLPPKDANHPVDDCTRCHQRSDHIDGGVQLGLTDDGCQGCHGTPENPAPDDRDHRRHLAPRSLFGSAIECATCHDVPETVTSAGHLDSDFPAEVFPETILSTSLAGPNASYVRPSRTCAEYCHFGVSPPWSSGQDIQCDSCHAVPPRDASHDPAIGVAGCGACHPLYGTEHIDGRVDVR